LDLPEPSWLTYQQAREQQRTHPVRVAEVPVEHAVSLPLPSLRFGVPAYAQFAAPALRSPDHPQQQGPPDRWWVLDARSGRLVVYALMSAVPFAVGASFGAVTLPPFGCSLDELRKRHAELDDLLGALSPLFLTGRPGEPAARKHARELLETVVRAPLLDRYRALAPDFFSWLEA
jgi:hypothetical protein